ncbi:MAG: glycosyltransferase [Bacteroidetes bacterium]|nr:glycosyltransferase [Bacteroidota bacterium]
MHTNPLVSVIIPCYNSELFIKDTIESVLNQSYSPVELIIVDDGSVDKTKQIIEECIAENKNIFLYCHEDNKNLGVSKSRQLGVKKATGKYIAFLDADDVWLPNKLSGQIDILEKDSTIILCHSSVTPFSDDSEAKTSELHDFIYQNKSCKYHIKYLSFLVHNHICNSTVVLRADVLKGITFSGSFLFQFEDWLLWLLIGKKGYFYYQNDPLIRYRYHESSSTMGILKSPNQLKHNYSRIELYISFLKFSRQPLYVPYVLFLLAKEILRIYRKY